MAINTPVKAYKEMASRWELPLTLWGGTSAMREAAKEYLPKLPEENHDAYLARVNRSFLFNVYRRTILTTVGNAFTNNITVSGIPDELKYLEWNANGQGQSLTEHAAELFEDILIFGKCHNFVDFPSTDIQAVSYAEYQQMGLRPFFARVSPVNLIGWDIGFNNGYEEIRHIRISDSEIRITDDWCEEEREIIRLITPESISTFARNFSGVAAADGAWNELTNTPNELGYVPLQSAYANKKGTFVADPTLEDLAWLNLQHFQSASDQQNILHIARVPFLLAKGFDENKADNLTISINNMVVTDNKDASISYIEHGGNAIDSGREHGKDLEEQMNRSGAEILFNKTVARQTTSNRKIDQAEALSVSQRSLRSIEQMLEQCFLVAADWMDIPRNFEPVVNIGADLELAQEPNPISSFVELCTTFKIKPEVMLEEGKRRGIFAKHLTVNDIKLIEKELGTETTTQLVNQAADGNEPEAQQTESEN